MCWSGIEHLDHRPRLNVPGGDLAFSLLLDINPAEISVPTHLEANFLQIEYHIRNVFQDTGDGGEFVQNAVYLYVGYGCTLKG